MSSQDQFPAATELINLGLMRHAVPPSMAKDQKPAKPADTDFEIQPVRLDPLNSFWRALAMVVATFAVALAISWAIDASMERRPVAGEIEVVAA